MKIKINLQKIKAIANTKGYRWLRKGSRRQYTRHGVRPYRFVHAKKRPSWSFLVVAGLSIFALQLTILATGTRYQLSPQAESLVGESNEALASHLEYRRFNKSFEYNEGYTSSAGVSGQGSGPKFSASFGAGSSKATTVKDPVTDTSITFEPKYDVDDPYQDQNRLIYPLSSIKGAKVVSLKSVGFKEDIIIDEYQGDELSFAYDLTLEDGTEARLESDGSIAVYGADPVLLGDVAVSSDEDQKLLDEARRNSDKQTLLFTIPAPFVKEPSKSTSDVETYFTLEGSELTIHARGLSEADYPLSIDPSVYVESAVEFMRVNVETNIDFSIDSELLRKGGLTGGSFDDWISTLTLNQGVWNAGTATAGGYVYSVGGNDGTGSVGDVYWARVNSNNQEISSPNPGDGVCSGWCNDPAYNLPEAREGLSLVTYNGYLYAMGGIDSAGNRSDHVYIAKLGSNGEPRLWHPTNDDKETWVYWYRDVNTNLSSERSYHAAVVYQNRLYILGGQTDTAESGTTTVEYADIEPNGTFGNWSTDGMSILPAGAGRHFHSAEVYNDRLYVIGGVEGTVASGNILGSVFYAKLHNGSLSDWRQTGSLSSPRMTWGGGFTAVAGGYIYQTGGCSAVNDEDIEENIAEGTYCTDIEQSTQLASINADGSLAPWSVTNGSIAQYIGHNLVSWNGVLYQIGGCSLQDESTGECSAVNNEAYYSIINVAGDISEVSLSSSSGSGTCDGADPYDCNLPPAGSGAGEGGQLLSASALVRGYLYVIGGCTDESCNNISGNVSYAQVSPEGTLSMPETCTGDYYGAWCVDSDNSVNGNSGVAAAGVATLGDTIYLVGGLDGNSNTNAIFRNRIEDDGTLRDSWVSQDLSGGAGVGATSVAHAFAHARANPTDTATSPGSLYIFGGCDSTSGAECDNESYVDTVYKCDIGTSGAIANCDTAGQLQIDTVSGATDPGLALHGGAVYADYIYLTGGSAPGQGEIDTVRYAMFNDDNDVVAVNGSSWIESPSMLNTGRAAGGSFALNGYLYSLGGFNGTDVLDDVEFARINPSDGTLDSFYVSNISIDSRWGQNVAVTNSKAYILGGCSGGAGTDSCLSLDDTVRTIHIHNNASGATGNYTAAQNLFDGDRIAANSAVYDGYIYLAGGCTDSATCAVVTSDVQYAPLSAHGNIGSWSATSAPLPDERAWGQLEAVGGTLYYIGGQNEPANASSDVFYADITPTGDVTSWDVASNVLPSALTQLSVAVWDDRMYVTGGQTTGGTVQDSVYVSPQLSSGGDITSAWTTSTSFNVGRSGHTAAAYGGNLYILGGYDDTAYLKDTQVAKINSDGTIGDWSFSSTLPMPVRQGDGFAANGYIYLFGGRYSDDEESCLDRTYVAPISANTLSSEGDNPTGLGEWFEANSRFGGERFGIAASYHEGRAYLLGGGCAELLNLAEVYTSAGEHTFTSPEDTTQVVIEAWGGGGGGGHGGHITGAAGNASGAGGGGGGYARHTMPVTPGDYTLVVGEGGSATEDGEGSWFDSETTAFAEGGFGASWGPNIGIGGSANIGSDATFSGGSGGEGIDTAQPANRRGGGGGGSAFNDADGGDGQDGTHQAGSGSGGIGEGDGGSGGVGSSAGGPGFTPGAGGGGGGFDGLGGDGAVGRVIVYYQEWSELVLTGSNRVSMASLYSQPQVASYSYMIDTDTDVFPYAWLMNGTDNSSKSLWQLQYLSSTSDTSVWGQDTNYEAVTLGLPESYVPLDGSGVNTNFARYYYFSISVDSATTFGFPYSTARSPTVTDLSLFFTADPSRRLRHGGTFTDGIFRSYDTPFSP